MSLFQNAVKAARELNQQHHEAQQLEEQNQRDLARAMISPILAHLEEKDNYKLVIEELFTDEQNHYNCRYRARVVIPSECGAVVIESRLQKEFAVGRASTGKDKSAHARTFTRPYMAILYAAILAVIAREEDIVRAWTHLEDKEDAHV